MTKYLNKNGDSGILSYEIQADGILVQFSDFSEYLYTNLSAGINNIVQMKELAMQGYGLNSFINKHVRTGYQSKVR